MGDKNQPQVIGALRRLTFAERHGKHVGQEGVKGQAGGSAPGFTHAEGGGAAVIGTTFETWTKQPFDESLANEYGDAIEAKYGLADENFVNATWIAPDGRTIAEGSIHEETSQHAISEVNNDFIDDITITETQVIQSGLIRHSSIGAQDFFFISGINNLTNDQKRAIKSIMEARVDQKANVQIQGANDRHKVGLRMFIVEEIPASIDPISREAGRVSGKNLINILGLNKNDWRLGGTDKILVVSKAPRFDWEGKLIVERFIMPDHEIDVDEISYDWVSGLKDLGIHTVPIEPKDGIIAMPRARVKPEEEDVEKKSLLTEVRRSLGGLLEAIADQYSGVAQQAGVARHGKHVGQEGRKGGEKGGSKPGFTHGEGREAIDGPTNVDEFGNKSGDLKSLYGPNWDAGDDFILVRLDEFDPESGDWVVEVISGPAKENTLDFVGQNDLNEPDEDLLDTWTSKNPVALENRARDIFGLTESLAEAGYILDNGDMLDFSGAREGGTPGRRALDHRDINRALLEDEGPDTDSSTEVMVWFAQETGAIRVSYAGAPDAHTAIDIYTNPTSAQWRMVEEFVEFSTSLSADITDPETGNVIWSTQEEFDFDDALSRIREQAVRNLLESKSIVNIIIRYSEKEDTKEAVERHGKHIDQEGRKGGDKGGSKPGFKHAEGDATKKPISDTERASLIERLKAGESSNDLINEYWGKDDDLYYITRDQVKEFLEEMGVDPDADAIAGEHPAFGDVLSKIEEFEDIEGFEGQKVYNPHEANFILNWYYGEKVSLEDANLSAEPIQEIEWVKSEINKFANEHGSQDFETANLYDRNDQLVISKDGEEKMVRLDVSESMRLREGVLIHNHPSSSGFSDADVLLALNTGSQETYAVGRDGSIFGLRVNPDLSIKGRQLLAQEFKLFQTGRNKDVVDTLYFDGQLTDSQAWTELWGNALMSLEKKYPKLIDYSADNYDHLNLAPLIEGWEDTSK